MESLIVPAGDSDVKSMLKESGVILLADWASSGKQKVNDRRERACALLWARSMLNEPEAYLHLSPTLMTYLQGLYKIRAEHLKTSRWAVALASIVSANMADKGHRRRNSRPTTVVVCQSALRDQQRPRTCRGLYSPRRIGNQLIHSSSRLHHSCSPIPLPHPPRLGRPAPSSGLQIIDVDSHAFTNRSLQRQQAANASAAANAVTAAANPFSSLQISQLQPHRSQTGTHSTGGGQGLTHWHSESELLAVIPDPFRSIMYYSDNFSATQRATHDKHVARRQATGDWVEDQSNPMFCHRITITFSESDTSEVPTEEWSMALLSIFSFCFNC